MTTRASSLAALSACLTLGLGALPAAAQEFPAQRLYVASSGDGSLFGFGGQSALLDANGQAQTTGEFAAGTGLAFQLGPNRAGGLAFGPDGRVYVASLASGAVQVYAADGQLADTLGDELGNFLPASLAFGPDGHLYVGSSLGNDPIHEFDLDGTHLRAFGPDGSLNITGLAFGPGGHLFVSAFLVDVVKEFDSDGTFLRNLGAGLLSDPRELAFGPDGVLYVASSGNDQVLAFDAEGGLVASLGGGLLQEPSGLAFGPDRRLYVSSSGTDSVVVFDAPLGGGGFSEFGADVLDGPLGLAFVPLRMTASIKGSLGGDLGSPVKLSEKATLSVLPGSTRVQLELHDADGALANLLGSPYASFHGFEALQGPGSKKLLLQGLQLGPRPRLGGTASIALLLSGKPDAGGALRARKAQGSLQVANPEGVLTANVRAGKPLN